jgi:lysozyme
MTETPQAKKSRIAVATALAVALAGPAEGIRRVAYYDPPGILTVCEGHTGPDIIKGKVYSFEECAKFMDNDMRQAVATVERCQPGLPVNMLAAYSDAVYNLGGKIVCDKKASTAARMLAAHDFGGACGQLPRWDKASVGGFMVALPGLTKRRLVEYKVCMKDVP